MSPKSLSLDRNTRCSLRVIDQVQRGLSLLETVERVGCHFTVAYDWAHRFNERFATFERVPNRKGRPPNLRPAQLRELVEVAYRAPRNGGCRFRCGRSPIAEY